VFGRLLVCEKIKYRNTECETLEQLSDVVDVAVRFPAWNWRKWKPFLDAMFGAVLGIRYAVFNCAKYENS